MGARVIKIRASQGGDFARAYDTRVKGLASHFVWTNRSKQSRPGPEACGRGHGDGTAAGRADVLIQNLAPGATARMGLDYASLEQRFPRLIVCDISGYGGDGPQRDKKAYDLLIQSEAGFVSTTGTADEPAKAGISVADIAAGMYAYTNILNALILRARTGAGSHIDLSMLEALAEWMSFPMYYAFDGAPPPPRAGASHATIYPYGPFKAGDGKSVVLGLQNEREWAAFCDRVMGEPALARHPDYDSVAKRSTNRKALRALIEASFKALDVEQVKQRLDDADIGYGQMNEMADLWAHPQLKARGRWTEVGTSAGPIPALLPPGRNPAYEPRMDPVPALGEHTGAILREIGFADAEIEALAEAGAI